MLRFTYTNIGQSPFSAIKSVDAAAQQNTGQFQNGNILYGEVDTPSENQSALATALSAWSPTFLTDEQALAYLDTIAPLPAAVVQKKIVQLAASFDGSGRAMKSAQEVES